MKKNIILAFCLSLLLSLLTYWISGYSFYVAAMVETTCFGILTYCILEKCAVPENHIVPYIAAILTGRIVFYLPLRIIEFPETLYSIFISIDVVIGILLAALYYKEKRISVLVLSVIILILLSTIGQMEWLNAFHYGK